MFSALILRSSSSFLLPQLSSLSINSIVDRTPPLVGQAIGIKEYLRENSIPFDESWTSIKALCCRSSNRFSGLIHLNKERGKRDEFRGRTSRSFSLFRRFRLFEVFDDGQLERFSKAMVAPSHEVRLRRCSRLHSSRSALQNALSEARRADESFV